MTRQYNQDNRCLYLPFFCDALLERHVQLYEFLDTHVELLQRGS